MSAQVYLHPTVSGCPHWVRYWERRTGCTAYVTGHRVELRKTQSSFGWVPIRRPWRLS